MIGGPIFAVLRKSADGGSRRWRTWSLSGVNVRDLFASHVGLCGFPRSEEADRGAMFEGRI